MCERAREVGALVLLDAYQSLGTVPVDVQALGVDMVCGGSVKWLCGGPGAAYLYVRPGLMEELEPRITGWAAHIMEQHANNRLIRPIAEYIGRPQTKW